jgi:hypothetical protein
MDIKPTKTYKMSKSTKTILALGKFRSAEDRNAWKRAMIGAELAAAVVIKREPRNDKK